jgi:hypothetical protein
VDQAGLINENFNQQMGQYNQQLAKSNAAMGGLFGLGSSLLGGWAIDPLLPDSWIPDLPGRTLGERYDNALARQRGADKAFDDRHPYISHALQLLGKAGSAAAYGPGPIIGDIAAAGIEGFGSEEGGFSNRAERAVHDAAEEALKVFGLDALKGRVMPAKAGTEGGRKAGAKAALTRALLRAGGRNGGGGW